MAGRMVHVEIPVDDTAKGRAFWGGLFGYEFQAFEGAPSEYHMFRTSEDTGGAISEEPGKRGPRVYFDCDDIRASAAKVKELGGTTDEPMAVPSMGWFAVCQDDSGNEFGLWQTDPDASM
jgi:predicted enzyme related to lactoylglutathione lyase